MHIVILGAGQVGATLARNLAWEDNDITLVDLNEQRLRELQQRLDIQTVHGSAAHPDVLISAGIERADMLIAVTDSDEINMMGCQIAYSLFRTPMKIARIRSRHYYNYPQLFQNEHVPVDVCICPEKLITEHIQNLIAWPGATQVLDFAEGKVLVVAIKVPSDGVMSGKSIKTLYQHLSHCEFRIIAIFRERSCLYNIDDADIKANDKLLIGAAPDTIQQVLTAFGQHSHTNRRIMIAGGGHIGATLAEALENRYQIKVIENNVIRANALASQLHKGTVLQGDIADRELLVNENIEFTDVFCAVTNDDEANIMSCLQAKRLGARHVMALVNRSAYVELIEDSVIDQSVSPQSITIGFILTKIRGGNMVKIHHLHHGDGEVIELITHGDEETSHVIGRNLSQLSLPPGCSIVAVVRGEAMSMASTDLILESGDHVVIFVLKKRQVRHIESLFQVKLTFMS